VKCVSSWPCLLRNYVTMTHGQQNIKLKSKLVRYCNSNINMFINTWVSRYPILNKVTLLIERISTGCYYTWETNVHFHYRWWARKCSEIYLVYKSCCVVHNDKCACRNWWSDILSGLNIKATLWKKIAAVKTQIIIIIIMYCFRRIVFTIDSIKIELSRRERERAASQTQISIC
jgi:hypothetical protein